MFLGNKNTSLINMWPNNLHHSYGKYPKIWEAAESVAGRAKFKARLFVFECWL